MSIKRPDIRVAVFISGRGSNMKSLVHAAQDPEYPATIDLIVSNNPQAPGLAFAEEHNIPTLAISHKDFDSREAFEMAILKAMEPYTIDIVCLAGFMRILSPVFIEQWGERLINIHPSLLPKHKGLDTHESVLWEGDTHHGCTVHYVVPEVDSGEIIIQRAIEVSPEDDPDTLAARVLKQEHAAYPEALKIVAEKLINEKIISAMKNA